MFALIAIGGAVLVVLASPSTPGRLTLASPGGAPQPTMAPHLPTVRIAPAPIWIAPSPSGRIVAMDINRIGVVDINDSGVDNRTVGSVLLTVGLAGVVPLTMFWLWIGPGRWSRRRGGSDDRPSAPAY